MLLFPLTLTIFSHIHVHHADGNITIDGGVSSSADIISDDVVGGAASVDVNARDADASATGSTLKYVGIFKTIIIFMQTVGSTPWVLGLEWPQVSL